MPNEKAAKERTIRASALPQRQLRRTRSSCGRAGMRRRRSRQKRSLLQWGRAFHNIAATIIRIVQFEHDDQPAATFLRRTCQHNWRPKCFETVEGRFKLVAAGLQFTKEKLAISGGVQAGKLCSILNNSYCRTRNRSAAHINELSAHAPNWLKWRNFPANNFGPRSSGQEKEASNYRCRQAAFLFHKKCSGGKVDSSQLFPFSNLGGQIRRPADAVVCTARSHPRSPLLACFSDRRSCRRSPLVHAASVTVWAVFETPPGGERRGLQRGQRTPAGVKLD